MNVNIPNECKKRPHKQGDVLIQFGIRIVILQSSYIVWVKYMYYQNYMEQSTIYLFLIHSMSNLAI